MVTATDRLEGVSAVGGTRIDAEDAIFIIKPCKSIEWGANMKISSKSAKWYTYETLLVITNLSIMKLTWLGRERAKNAHDLIVEQVRDGNIRSMVDLYSLMSSFSYRYGAPVVLIETKLERYYD